MRNSPKHLVYTVNINQVSSKEVAFNLYLLKSLLKVKTPNFKHLLAK